MTLTYQRDLLRYMVQSRGLKNLIEQLDPKIFTIAEDQLVFELIQKFIGEYKTLPKRNALWEFATIATQSQQLAQEVKDYLQQQIDDIYSPPETNEPMLFQAVVDFAKRSSIRNLMIGYAGKTGELKESDFVKIQTEIAKINQIGREEAAGTPGKYLIKDFSLEREAYQEGHPCAFRRVNQMTAANGFRAPEIVVFLAQPKGFKTGTLLTLAVDYQMKGYNVLYCDTENGVEQLSDRAYQKLISATYEELYHGEFNEELEQKIDFLKRASHGDIRFEYFPAKVSTLYDVEAKIQELKEKDNFVPDIIIYDYFDKFGSGDRKITEKRLIIQDVYDHAIRINNKWKTFCISVSQVKQTAVNRPIIRMTDFAEDFGKAANVHAAFAICRTQWEQDNGYAHIIPAAQRAGSRFIPGNECFVKIDEARMTMEEVTDEFELEQLRQAVFGDDEEIISEEIIDAGALSDEI